MESHTSGSSIRTTGRSRSIATPAIATSSPASLMKTNNPSSAPNLSTPSSFRSNPSGFLLLQIRETDAYSREQPASSIGWTERRGKISGMTKPDNKSATYRDLQIIADNVIGELFDGEI